jgi:hypothetical protein
LETLAVDARLLEWLDDRRDVTAETYRPVVEAAWWTTGSRLADAADELVAAAVGHPRLLDELAVARLPLDPVTAVTTAEKATAAVSAARDWLWQNREQVAVAHLRLATQLGLAIHTVLGAESAVLDQWREAAAAAGQLRGTPPTDTARSAGQELAEALRWAREQATTAGPADSGQLRELTRLAERLPGLADALYVGLQKGVQRQDVFVREASLTRPSGSLVYRVTERWRPAVSVDDQVRGLSRMLVTLSRPAAESAAATAALAFPTPTRPSARAVGTVTPAPRPAATPASEPQHDAR